MVNDKSVKNSNYQRIEGLIISGYISLSSQMHYSSITVTNLCKYAQINRTTFYKHYRGTWEIKDQISERLMNVIISLHDHFREESYVEHPHLIFEEVNESIKANRDFIFSVINMKGSHVFIEEMMDEIKAKINIGTEKVPIDYHIKTGAISLYLMGGIFNTYYEWIRGKLKCSLEEIADILTEFYISAKRFGEKN